MTDDDLGCQKGLKEHKMELFKVRYLTIVLE